MAKPDSFETKYAKSFFNQLESDGRIDINDGTLKLPIVGPEKPEGVILTIRDELREIIFNAMYGEVEDQIRLLNLKMADLKDFQHIASLQCANSHNQVPLDQNITRSFQLAISEFQLELALTMKGDNAELVADLERQYDEIISQYQEYKEPEDLEESEESEE